jgi:glutamate:GABA antiporter
MTLGFIGSLVTSGAVWMIGSDRVQAVAAYDGAFFSFFGVFNRKLGTPVRVNVLSGLVATAFCVSAVAFFDSGANATFQVVLDIAISTTLLSYILIFPAILKLRYSHPDVHRPYIFPFGKAGVWIGTVVVTFFVLLGSWVAVFPDTIEKVVGVDYGSFKAAWGVSRLKFEAYTLGTLAIIILIGVAGYLGGASTRRAAATVPIGEVETA